MYRIRFKMTTKKSGNSSDGNLPNRSKFNPKWEGVDPYTEEE